METGHKLNDLLVTVKMSYAELNKAVQSLKFTRDMRKTTDDINELRGLKTLIKDLDTTLEGARDYFSDNRNNTSQEEIDDKITEQDPNYCPTCE